MNQMSLRLWHSYVGLFIAPSILFFALTGAVQLFGLHEAHGDYEPPAIVEKLAQVHKDQVFVLRHRPAPPPGEADTPRPAKPEAGTPPKVLLLKCFFLVVALGLVCTTTLGLWIGLANSRRKRTSWLVLAAGALIPLVLLLV